MAGRKYLKKGWVFAEPYSQSARLARAKWGLPQEPMPQPQQTTNRRYTQSASPTRPTQSSLADQPDLPDLPPLPPEEKSE